MLTLYQSNQMSKLADAFCSRNAEATDPFEPLTLVVQNLGMGHWLKLQLAERHGISSNVNCVLPAAFLWRLYRSLIPETERLTESPFEAARLTWRIMRLLRANPGLSDSATHYLAAPGDEDLRLYQLSHELALLFDEYLMYRPGWLLKWPENFGKKSAEARWQGELWRSILDDAGDFRDLHRAALHQRALEELAKPQPGSRRQLSIFGLSSMPPLQLETYAALAASIDIDIYFLNPCRHYWGDIVSTGDKARRSIRSITNTDGPLSDEDYLEIGNPLLGSLGKQGREYFELLLETDLVQPEEMFVEFPPDTALNLVKNDILDLTFSGQAEPDEPPKRFTLQDNSIQIHACHSRMREVEVLHDRILHALGDNPDLQLKDIIVMAPNIADYAPFVQSVFTGGMFARIADRSTLDDSLLPESVLTLLTLNQSRLTGPEVMDLLEVPAIMRRFMLTLDDLETIAQWVDESHIRWEVSGKHKKNWNLPTENQNTWMFGLDRLLLGFAMTEEDIWEDTLAIEINPAEADLLGRLCDMIHLLDEYRRKLSSPRSMDEWLLLITRLAGDFYEPREAEILQLSQLLQKVEQVVNEAAAGGWGEEVSSQLVAHAIREALSAVGSRPGFITGGITFATLTPMRSIPFRMVCLLGMNDGEYPRIVKPRSFNLIANGKAARGDRSKRLDDRYLFLEALLSAQDIFYVSYIGKGIRDNKDKPRSVVVNEWWRYLTDAFEKVAITAHFLQPFNRRYYLGDNLQSHDRTWYEALTATSRPPGFVQTPLATKESLACTSVAQLTRFLVHPGMFFMQQRLGVYLQDQALELQDTEPFEPDALDKYWMGTNAVTALTKSQDMDEFRQRQMGSGILLPGTMGRQHLDQEIRLAENIFNALNQEITGHAETLKEVIQVGETNLHLQVDNLYADKLVNWRTGVLRPKQLLEMWLLHLAVNLSGRAVSSIYIHPQQNNKYEKVAHLSLPPVTAEMASTWLEQALSLYEEGISAPLFLPVGAGYTFAEGTIRKRGGLAKAMADWGKDDAWAEGKDRYWARLFSPGQAFPDRFSEDALTIWQPFLEVTADA